MKQTPKAKEGELRAVWCTSAEYGPDGDLVFAYGDGVGRADAHLLSTVFCVERATPELRLASTPAVEPSLLEELKRRGYDLATFTFSIQKKRG